MGAKGVEYLVHGGRISTWSLECHPVDHCNLRCEGCCQLSPHLSEASITADGLASDLARLREVLRPLVFKLTGGEPLLHPEIVRLVEVAKASGVAPAVQITTNGTRLASQPDALFDAVDRVKVSWYASAPLSERTLERIRRRCRDHAVELTVREYGSFQALDPPELERDERWAERAFSGCWIRWRCHTVHRGRLYTCSRPPHLEPFLRARGLERDLAARDGVDLAEPDLFERVLAYLGRDSPLASCRHCLGNEGPWRPHRQLPVVRSPARTGP